MSINIKKILKEDVKSLNKLELQCSNLIDEIVTKTELTLQEKIDVLKYMYLTSQEKIEMLRKNAKKIK